MKFMKLTFGLATLALGIASAASSYSVKLNDSVSIGSTQMKVGEYKVEMQGSKAVFKIGKTAVEVPATLVKSDQKYAVTSLVSEGTKLLEIDLGGTSEKILFSPAVQQQRAGGSE
jgi:hypothetical protein